jgi:hypothetical protein
VFARVFERRFPCFPDRFHVEIYIVPDRFYVVILRFLDHASMCERDVRQEGVLISVSRLGKVLV